MSFSNITDFEMYLICEEKSLGTIEKYLRDVKSFSAWLNGEKVTKDLFLLWKTYLVSEGYSPKTINSMIASVNAYLHFIGEDSCKVRYLRVQRSTFREQEKELSVEEYRQLVTTAYNTKKERLGLLLETLAGTGIRVGEIRFLTVEAVKTGRATISLKGKIRTIILPEKLRNKILKYAKKNKITSGEVFLTRSGKSLDRKQIWAEMKKLCKYAGISNTKVFPHNLRHLFAKSFYETHKNVVRLADVLGHSSIDTTRTYLISTGEEHARMVEELRLIC